MHHFLILFIASLIQMLILTLNANPEQEFPVLYKGRFRPAEAYARLWLYELYHAPTLKATDLAPFHTSSSSPLSLLWSLNTFGYLPYQKAPLFWIDSAKIKHFAGLPLTRHRFSYEELIPLLERPPPEEVKDNKKLADEWSSLLIHLREFAQLIGAPPLEQEAPLIQRLKTASSLFKALPGRYQTGEWFPLQALQLQVEDPSSHLLKPIGNFTLFSDADFEALHQAYFTWEKQPSPENQQRLSQALQQAYLPLAGQIYQTAHGKQLYYPTWTQLKMETLYVSYPWIPLLILLYGLAACTLLMTRHLSQPFGDSLALGLFTLALLCHTGLLAIRCYILGRPPVSNMFETVIYVPWVAACLALLFPPFRHQRFAQLAASLASIILLLILEMTSLNQSLDQVQAVLDSQFWLMIHVLLVVGSYGIFILGSILGHFYLGCFFIHRTETPLMKLMVQLILQTMYGGTLLLISGTILGGIWAAESWGRFWDWDPKESWAFISSCFYLIWIHAYRFHRIASFGLALGAVSGYLAISFTWYGVNYLLGTGLHSYGFGSGGEIYYFIFLGAEGLFLATTLGVYFRRCRLNLSNTRKFL